MAEKHLVFDAYGTLLQVSSHIPNLNDEQQKLSENVQALWRTKQLEYTWLRSLMGKFKGFNVVTREALNYACQYYELEDQALKQSILSIFEQPSAFDDAVRFLDQCNPQGFKTAILSNGEQSMLERSVEVANIDQQIDHILSASHVQIFKPSPQVYELATTLFSCNPSDIIFFSSNPWDIAGGAHFGFQTVWINRQGLPFETLSVNPWKVVDSFDGLRVSDLA